MKINQVLVESAGATVAFAFGRFNPAHQGHIEVWRTVEQSGANWFIGTNPSTLGPNDPLTFQQKSSWMTEIYPAISGHIVAEQTVLTLATYIFKKTRKNENATVAYITDAADWAWSGKLLNQYNGVEGAHGYYKFAEITHVPSPRVSSATALRDAARADDRVAFYHASGTDPKSKVAGLTYFDTVKQAVEKYPLPVKKVKKVKEQGVAEGWSQKYKSSINCSHPKGFSQKAHCAGKKKHNESHDVMEMTCPDCGMCQTHGNVMEIKKGAKDSNGFTKCWPGHHAAGTKKGKNGGQVRNCVPNESQGVAEEGYGNHPSQRVDPRTGKKYVPPRSPLGQGVAEGAPELLKKEMPTHRHAEKLLAQNGVSKDDPDYHHHLGNTIKYLRQFGNIDLINKSDEQGVAEEGYGNHPSQRVDPRTGKKYVPPRSPLGQGVAEGSVTPDVTVNKVHDDGHEKEWHIYRGKEMIGYVKKNQPDTAEGLYIAYGHGPGRAFVEEFTGLKPAVNYIASLKEGVVEDSLGLKKLHDALWTVISEQTIDEETINEIDPGMIANLYSVFPTVAKIIVSNALNKARKEAKETSLMIDVMKKHANNQPVTPEESEAMKTQFKDIVSYGLSAVAGVLTGAVAGPAAGAGVALAGAYKKELLTLLQTKGPEVLIGLLKSKGKLDVVDILSAKLLGKHALPFYAAPKMAESEQKTVAKTWDQMTPQEKSSGVKGRTVWNEKTQRYYTVFDVPANEVDEASLATMRDYFAGDENARDPYDITKQRLHFAKDKNGRPTVDKRFRSPAEYQLWLKQNKLRQISGANESTNDKGWILTNKKTQ